MVEIKQQSTGNNDSVEDAVIAIMNIKTTEGKLINFDAQVKAVYDALEARELYTHPAPQTAQEPVAWMYEDELPTTYPYDVMFQYSSIRDGVRMFPVYKPKHENVKTPLEQAEAYSQGNTKIQTAYEDGFIAGTSYQIQKEVEIRMLHPAPSWQGLSEDDLVKLYHEHFKLKTKPYNKSVKRNNFVEFGLSIQRILKEKNHGHS